jgi:FtsP/CotA-like multicopper oxidase with cupredoxin domain
VRHAVIRGPIAAMGLGVALLLGSCSTKSTTPPPSSANPTTKEYPATGVTKTVELTITEFDWQVAPGAIYQAIGYNAAIPGPTIDVTAGDHVVIKLTNKATAPHSVHTHVVRFANGSDGVKNGVANPGQTVTVEWDAVFAGTFPYHDHAGAEGETDGVCAGLFGALVVHAPDEPKAAKENVILLSDFDLARYKQLPGVDKDDAGPSDAGIYRGGHQYMHTIDGRAYEEWTPHFQAKTGDLVRWRVISKLIRRQRRAHRPRGAGQRRRLRLEG